MRISNKIQQYYNTWVYKQNHYIILFNKRKHKECSIFHYAMVYCFFFFSLCYYKSWKETRYIISGKKTDSKPSPGHYLSTMRSSVRFLIQSTSPLSPSSTSRPQGTQGNSMIWVEPSLRLRPGYVPKPGEEKTGADGYSFVLHFFARHLLFNRLLL